MQTERLKLLAEKLKTVPPEQFNLDEWYQPEVKSGEYQCGFAACAVGWATMMPEFREQGLVLDDGTPRFKGSIHWEAVEEFFEIDEDTAHHLFHSSSYFDDWGMEISAEPKDVANRIESLIIDGEI